MQENLQSSTKVVFVGSFDPFHEGHLNIVTRALKLFGKVIIGIGVNPEKTYMFTADERLQIIKNMLTTEQNVEVEIYEGLTIDFARRHNAVAIVKGVRNYEDFVFEQLQAKWNKEHGGIDTIIMVTEKDFENASSSVIRENINNDSQK